MTTYWWKLIAPLPLNAYHLFSPVTSLHDLRALASLLFLSLAVTVLLAARRHPLFTFAASWVFITLLPVMDIYAVGRNVFAERYLYLPSVGFCLLVTMAAFGGLVWIPERLRKVVAVSALGFVVLLLALAIIARNRDWKDDSTLFARTLERSPNAPFVQNMVADTEKGDPAQSESAEGHYLKALTLASDEHPPDRLEMARACEGLASIYSDRPDFVRAIEFLDRVRSIDPADPEVDGEEGLIMTRAGRWDEASKYLERAVAKSPEDDNVLNALGILAEHTRQFEQAASYFGRALAIHTSQDDFSASLHNNLASVYGEQGRWKDAMPQLQLATEIAPNDPEYRTNLAIALAASGHYDEARSEIRAVLRAAPDFQPAREVLGRLDPH
jgi:Flp pilus assembly protein TadD